MKQSLRCAVCSRGIRYAGCSILESAAVCLFLLLQGEHVQQLLHGSEGQEGQLILQVRNCRTNLAARQRQGCCAGCWHSFVMRAFVSNGACAVIWCVVEACYVVEARA